MRIIVLEHQLVDVDLADAARDTTLRDLVREPVGAVQHDAHAAGDLGADGFEAVGYWKLTKLLEEVSRRGKKSIKTATKMRSKTRQATGKDTKRWSFSLTEGNQAAAP